MANPSKEETAKRNRELMPNVAKFVDEWRAVFPGLKVIWAKDLETGYEVGQKREEEGFVIPENYYPSTPVDLKKGRSKR